MAAAVVLRVRVRIAFVVAVHALQLRDARIRIGGFRPRKQRRRTRSAGATPTPSSSSTVSCRRSITANSPPKGGFRPKSRAWRSNRATWSARTSCSDVARRNQPPQTDGLSTAGIDARPHRFRTGDGRVPHHRRGNRVRRYGDQHHRPKEERGIHQSPAGQRDFRSRPASSPATPRRASGTTTATCWWTTRSASTT